MQKKCFKCEKIKLLEDFYKHPKMADGHVNKCKECNKKDVKDNYKDNHDYYIEYEKGKRKTPERMKNKLIYQITARKKYPEKNRARQIINKLMMSGKLIKGVCEVCGTRENIHAHHDDYSKPLDIRWLCIKHHFELHNVN